MSEKRRILELEERVAFAELSRDNAIALREEVQRRAKEQRKSIGILISDLRQHIIEVAAHTDIPTQRWALQRMEEILERRKGEHDATPQ